MFRIIFLSSKRQRGWVAKIRYFEQGKVLLKLGQRFIQLFLEFVQYGSEFRGSLIPGLWIRLGCVPAEFHGCVILHVLPCKLGLEFNDFIIYCFKRAPDGTLIFGFYADPIGPVPYYDIYWDKLLHVSNSCFNFKNTSRLTIVRS